jgi:hypothetical protein
MEILVFFFADLSAPAAIFLGVGSAATVLIPALLFADAHREDFPRLWQAAVHARHDVNRAYASVQQLAREDVAYVRFSLREAALTVAALLALLLPATEGATR